MKQNKGEISAHETGERGSGGQGQGTGAGTDLVEIQRWIVGFGFLVSQCAQLGFRLLLVIPSPAVLPLLGN